jgi:hypothetical protein
VLVAHWLTANSNAVAEMLYFAAFCAIMLVLKGKPHALTARVALGSFAATCFAILHLLPLLICKL